MSPAPPVAVILVDWGTTRLRLWAVDSEAAIVGEARSGEGMGATEPRAFEGILEHHLAALGAGAGVPVVMCGMVGSRQGWCEAPYLDVPARLDAVIDRAVRVPRTRRDVRILPGIADPSPATADVMRGEETQLVGLSRRLGGRAAGLVCMPGTHAKWVRLGAGPSVVDGFATALTGDLYAALRSASVLRHSVAGSAGPDPAAFDAAVAAALAAPASVLHALFAIRAHGLLHGADAEKADGTLSGTIIGLDIAGALERFGRPGRLTLVGDGALGDLYARALAIAGLAADRIGGEGLARDGLLAAARRLWPGRLAQEGEALAR